jgi:2-dehydro-3-deoxyglucarate aldolase
MDAGAAGVLVPNVKTAAEAKASVSAVKYPSLGTRGVGLARAQGYGLEFKSYEQWVNEGSIVVLQIEHVEGVENLPGILEEPGIDGIIIGPYDLSGSIGLPGKLKDPRVEDLITKVIDAAKEKDIALGYHVVQPDIKEVISRIKQGFTFIGYSLDTIILGSTFKEHLEKIESGLRIKRIAKS